MYKVMIVDDEMSARRLLQTAINWEGLDLEFAGEASSAEEALDSLDEIKPDIVFTDICMPFMNGIEFAKLATERYPELAVIMLTGFDDFEYARQCVSLPVMDYIMKPIVRKEIQDSLTKVIEKIKQRDAAAGLSAKPEETNNATDMELITQYLRENYTDSSINLTSVAQQFGFNASYLSRKFKQETGLSFVEYLMKCRMERAMELAQNDLKMFRAANEVGIQDPNYFGRCFKKYTGISYSEYVASHKSE